MGETFTAAEAASWIAVPGENDDKYSRGVLGFVTGSAEYPGAAVLGVEAGLHTGAGMVRYFGPGRATRLVLQRRPEAVTSDGRVQAWVLGSGQAVEVSAETAGQLDAALGQGVPVVLDGGAVGRSAEASGPVVITPHAGELARITGASREEITADARGAALAAAASLNCVVLLKGHTTHVAAPDGRVLVVRSAPSWLATAGAGDALAGVLGALVATHWREIDHDPGVLVDLAATAAVVHGLAAARASGGGPFTILDLTAALPATIAELVRN